MATEYPECHQCQKKVTGWLQDILEQLDPTHRAMFPAILTYRSLVWRHSLWHHNPHMVLVPSPHWFLTIHAKDVQTWIGELKARATKKLVGASARKHVRAHSSRGRRAAAHGSGVNEWDTADVARLREAMQAEMEEKQGFVGLSKDQLNSKLTTKLLARHCRHCTQGAEETEELVCQLLEAFHDVTNTMGVPLLDNKRMDVIWNTQRQHLNYIQDPPGLQLHMKTGPLTKGEVVLPMYRCAWGSTSTSSANSHSVASWLRTIQKLESTQQCKELREDICHDLDAPDGTPEDESDWEDEGYTEAVWIWKKAIPPSSRFQFQIPTTACYPPALRQGHLLYLKTPPQAMMMVFQGPDGAPVYDRVVTLARYLVGLCDKPCLSKRHVADIIALWNSLPEVDRQRVSYLLRHRERLLKGRFKASHSKTTTEVGWRT
ncbi:hypothetical protein AOLI_G00038160 [Acnodon oligacanthus]